MRVILTFSEIHSGNDLVIKITERLQGVVPHLAKDMKTTRHPLAELEKIENMFPNMVKVDTEQKLVVFSFPEEMTVEVLKTVDEYYMDLLDIVPIVIGAIRLFNKATDRYVKHAEMIGEKFKKLMTKPVTE